jgi:hypothetical protein
MKAEEIKEKAYNKTFSKLSTLQFDLEALNRDIVNNVFGGLSLEQITSIKEYLESEIIIWSYIIRLIEQT